MILIDKIEQLQRHNENLLDELKQLNNDLGPQFTRPGSNREHTDLILINKALVNLLNLVD